MNETLISETLLREALSRAAAQAPDGARVRAALAAAPSTRPGRARPVLLTLAAAAVVAAVVALPVVLFGSRGGDDVVAPAVTPTAPSSFPGIDARVVVEPKWLPAGFRETDLQAGHHPLTELTRTWRKGEKVVSLGVLSGTPTQEVGTQTSVNGVEGRAAGQGTDKQILEWPQAGKWLTLIGVGVDAATLRRVAESVVPTEHRAVVPLRIGWLPPGTVVTSSEADTTDGWRLDAVVAAQDDQYGSGIAVVVTTRAPLKADPSADVVTEPVTVQGHEGKYVATTGHSELGPDVHEEALLVDLGGGVRLEVRFAPEEKRWGFDEAVRIADSVTYERPVSGAS